MSHTTHEPTPDEAQILKHDEVAAGLGRSDV